MLAAGTLNHRIQILTLETDTDSEGQVVVLQDSDGNVIENWQTFAECWANVRPASVREFIAAGAENSKVTVAVQIRYIAGVRPSMRIQHGDNLYNIEGVLPDPNSGREWLTLPCSHILTEQSQESPG